MPVISGSTNSPSILDLLKAKQADLTAQLKLVNDALAALAATPGLVAVVDAMKQELP